MFITAKDFAIEAHNSINHKRKYTGEPYWKHCERVSYLVSLVTKDEDMIAAAWLHDVLEDVTPKNPQFNADKIKQVFGQDSLNLVLDLTDISKPEDGNREARKAIDREHTFNASPRAKTIKLADLIDNARDICDNDKDFSKIFLKEMSLILPGLLNKENIALWEIGNQILKMEGLYCQTNY